MLLRLQNDAALSRVQSQVQEHEQEQAQNATPNKPILFLLKGYPRLSETFIAQEIYGLEQAGLPLELLAMRRPTDKYHHPIVDDITAPVAYLPEYLHHAPWRVLRGLISCAHHYALAKTWALFWQDFRRDCSLNRIRRFGQALVLAHEFGKRISRIHAHFVHTPASVARYASLLTGLPWSCSAHAKDIWITPDWDLADKLTSADFVVTCTQTGQARLNNLAPDNKPARLLYHGLDLARFPAPPARPDVGAHDGSSPERATQMLCVGRAVAKKGLDDLLAALALLPKNLSWHLTHIGGGALADKLKQAAQTLGLNAHITWAGSQPQTVVLEHYRRADFFVLPCKIAKDGDRDGLPNVLVEAQSQGLACLSTRIAGVEELITHQETGYLVTPGDAQALSAALQIFITQPKLRAKLGTAGQDYVRTHCDYHAGIVQLLLIFQQAEFRTDAANERVL